MSDPEPPARPVQPLDEDEGGDPACWANRVCPACGRLADDEPPTTCPECGTEIPGPDD